MWKFLRLVLIGFTLGTSLIWVTAAHAQPGKGARIDAGEWQVSEIDGGLRQRLCAEQPIRLTALLANGKDCTRMILENERRQMIVHYTCGDSGHGRIVMHVRDGDSVLLETQGVSRGAPFAVNYEARRVGTCSR